ncbi:hypothetical protein GGF37_006002, partial [Kickxella alabastrina]
SAKAFKRPTKKEKDTKKEAVIHSRSPAPSSIQKPAPMAVSKMSGGSVTKSKSTKLKTRIAVAKGSSKGKGGDKKARPDYLKLFAKKH